MIEVGRSYTYKRTIVINGNERLYMKPVRVIQVNGDKAQVRVKNGNILTIPINCLYEHETKDHTLYKDIAKRICLPESEEAILKEIKMQINNYESNGNTSNIKEAISGLMKLVQEKENNN